jgi:hypothetical protein
MAKFPSFLEYLNDKGQVVDKPETETVPDYHGKEEKSPPGSKVPYKTPKENKAPAKGETGFADMGDQKLNYKPGTNAKHEVKPDVMKEYVDEKGKVVEKAKTDTKADYKGKEVKAPKGGKPYSAKDAKKPSKKEMDAGLGKLGDKELEYVPDTAKAKKVMKTESFINKTKDMSLADFTKYMLEECGCGQVEGDDLPYVTAYTTGKFQPHPPEAIRYISALAGKNDGVLENLVSTMVSMGYLNTLLKIIFSYPQAYEELTSLFSDDKDGPDRCKSFAGAMSNSYSKFLSDQDDLYESVSSPMGFELDDLGEEDADEESDEEDLDSEEDSDHEEDLDSDEGSEDSSTEDEEEYDDEEDMEGEEPSEDDMEEEEPKQEKRLKKKFAHDHLLNAMRNHEHMFKAMRGI